jgi:hypothetical protein
MLQRWEDGVISPCQHETPPDTEPMTTTIPKTQSILEGLKQLPAIGNPESLVHKLAAAEIAMQEAQAKFEDEVRKLADEITEEGDGWTYDEIWKTDLRGNTIIMKHLRAKGLDA